MRRQALTAIVVAVAVAMLSTPFDAAAQRPRNLIQNGGFEEGDPDLPLEGWGFTSWGKIGPVHGGRVKKKKAHSGKFALCIVSDMTPVDFAAYSDLLPPVEAEEFNFSFFYRTKGDPGASANFVSFEGGFLEQQWSAPVVQAEKKALPPCKQWRPAFCRVRRPAAGRQSLVLFRVAAEGELYIDDVRVVEAEGPHLFEIDVPGLVLQPPRKRLIRLRLTQAALAEAQLVAHAHIAPRSEKPVSIRAAFAGRQASADLTYSLPEDGLHEADIVLVSKDQVTVYDGRTTWVRPALDAHLTRPAFRGTALSSMPWQGLTASCRVNAAPGAGGPFSLSAMLVEDLEGGRTLGTAGGSARPGESADLHLDLPRLPPGKYRLHVAASAGPARPGHADWRRSLPVLVPEERSWEVGYDERLRLLVDGKPLFPVGIFDVYRRADLQRAAEGGLNVVVAPRAAMSPEYLSEAHARGLKVIASAMQTNVGAWRDLLDTIAGSPALVGWLALNEPGARGVAPATAARLYEDLAAADPYHPVLCSLTDAQAMPSFVDSADVVLAASTPVPYWPLLRVAERVEAARQATEGHKPVWAVIQTVGRVLGRGAAAGPSGLARAPTPEEMRCMTYLALIHGAQGIVYSTYEQLPDARRAAFALPKDAPKLWAGVCAVAEQVRSLEPALVEGPTGRPKTGDERIQAASFEGGGWGYVIAVNTESEVAEGLITLPRAPRELRALFTQRQPQSVTGTEVRDRFLPYEVRIYRF
ncbi:MAG: hypothetical protein ACE5R4_04745 [Armatimonadota bacterium]